MTVEDLRAVGASGGLTADIVVVGGGPAAYAIAKELAHSRIEVLILESGRLEEEADYEALNAVESVSELTQAQMEKRTSFHGAGSATWSSQRQQYGVRCRALGGSSHAWVGKSAAFDQTDFDKRDWAANSGWPIEGASMDPFVERAAEVLNLGPKCNDERLWDLMGVEPPSPSFDSHLLRSFFWQFARSREDKMDFMRFGPLYQRLDAPNLRVLINATVTKIRTNEDGTSFEGLEVSTLDGVRSEIRAKAGILAAGGIENPRLLLASARYGDPIGKGFDQVGRFLMDHPSATIGRWAAKDCKPISDRFGFYGLNHKGQAHMYAHGVALSPELQEKEQLLNCAAYMLEERAADDPWDALKRLMRATSKSPMSDLLAVALSPGLLTRGLGERMLTSSATPEFVKKPVIDGLVRYFPNLVVRQYRDRGLPHKLTGITLDGITEQSPDPDSRIQLSETLDRFGVPIPKVNWKVDHQARNSLVRLGKVVASEFARVGLPVPVLEPWVAEERPEDAVIIDMAHTIGATRMSADPSSGVVDVNCQVHGVANLYVAGSSVFPTSGHANPTLMILALAIRLADHVRSRMPASLPAQKTASSGAPKLVQPTAFSRASQKSVADRSQL